MLERLYETEEARVKWREGLAVSSAAASRQERRTQHNTDASSTNATWTSRHDPKNGKKHKRAAKKSEKKAEKKELDYVNADRNALGLERLATKREQWERLDDWEKKQAKKEMTVAGRKGRDNRKEEWTMHGGMYEW